MAFETRKKKTAATQQQPAPLAAAAVAGGSAPAAAGQAPCCTPPGSPRQQQAAPLSALTSPGKLDTLLPGYVSRPNSSPVKARLLTAPPVAPVQLAAGHSNEMLPQQQQQQAAAEPVAKRARTLLSLAATRFGSSSGGRCGATAGGAGSTQAADLPAERGSAAAALEGPALGHLHADLRAELQQAALLGQQREGQRCAVEEEEGQGGAAAGSPEPAGQATAAAKPRRAPIRGAGSSKRKQPPAGKHADAAAAAPAAATQAEALGTRASGPQLPADAELDAAAAALPLPSLAQRLEASFVVLAQLHAFLTSTHIQVPVLPLHGTAAVCMHSMLSMCTSLARACCSWFHVTVHPASPPSAMLRAEPLARLLACRPLGAMCGRQRRGCGCSSRWHCPTAS